ncbi:sugar lactone lactonase YvrE [Sphingomonas sp. PP-CE-1A-559]|uniref:SMP-30/gluconolactonase/LRE family protein n=1 Tax=Sphingomonas sp. PP-CE-1A-559 TaxID=2135657 RepID=UPI0010553CA5|nr:SMP-30/gluconolactonase/LRE family protein [Sphingomonas sp. PP-CE-1A-559]TCP86020.1 sugar lactone lactonase YvrE [Sphingomonas sp. PP-CE-1A-559]
MEIAFFGTHRNKLGESPVWDDRRQCLWWVDSLVGLIHAAASDGTPIATFAQDRPVGSIGLAEGGLVAALADGFYAIDGGSGVATPIAIFPVDATLRLNDGKADRAGRFLSGQMQLHSGGAPSEASLWRLSAGSATTLAGGLKLTNGICFSPDGATLYFADSLEGVIRAHDYDVATGAMGPRRDVVDCAAFGSGPDGATVDADGNLWVALVLAQAVACIAPDGALLRSIALPIPYPACPAFGGPGLDTLYVTSIADSGGRLISHDADAGRILAITGLGVTGIQEGRYRDNHIRE